MSLSGKKILLTGGAGFVGRALARHLAEENEVIILDGFFRQAPWTIDAIPKRATIIKGNVLDEKKVGEAVSGCHIVVHLAAVAGINTVGKRPVTTIEVNFLGAANVLRAASRESCLERFINFSTSEVLGKKADRLTESDPTSLEPAGNRRWVYGAGKLAVEHLAFAHHLESGLPVVSIRPFNIYGPGQVGEGAIRNFVELALKNNPLTVYSSGNEVRSWCYIDDLVIGVLTCMKKPQAIGQLFHLGNPQARATTRQLAEIVIQETRSSSPIKAMKSRHEEVQLRVPNIEKATQILGFSPQIDLREGIRRTADFFRSVDTKRD